MRRAPEPSPKPTPRSLGVWEADDHGAVPETEFPEPGSVGDAYDAQLGTRPSYECDAVKRQDDHVPDMRTQELERLGVTFHRARDSRNES